jgi:hypothetical protein
VRAVLLRAGDQIGMKVPRVDHNSTCTRIGHQRSDLVVIGLRLGKRVVEDDIDSILQAHVVVDLGDDNTVAVAIEHVGHTHQYNVVVVDERDGVDLGSISVVCGMEPAGEQPRFREFAPQSRITWCMIASEMTVST